MGALVRVDQSERTNSGTGEQEVGQSLLPHVDTGTSIKSLKGLGTGKGFGTLECQTSYKHPKTATLVYI